MNAKLKALVDKAMALPRLNFIKIVYSYNDLKIRAECDLDEQGFYHDIFEQYDEDGNLVASEYTKHTAEEVFGPEISKSDEAFSPEALARDLFGNSTPDEDLT